QSDLEDLTQTRIDIESLALRRSIERGDDAWLAAVKREFNALSAISFVSVDGLNPHNEAWVVRHRLFHRTLVRACGSLWLLSFRDVLHEKSKRYRRLSSRREIDEPRDVEAEHAAIVRAVLARDADAAVDALARHFKTTMRFVRLAAPKLGGGNEVA